ILAAFKYIRFKPFQLIDCIARRAPKLCGSLSHPMINPPNSSRRSALQPDRGPCELRLAQGTLTRSQGRTASPTTHQGTNLVRPALLEPYVRCPHAVMELFRGTRSCCKRSCSRTYSRTLAAQPPFSSTRCE